MLTSGVRRGSLAALAVMLLMLVALTGGTAMVPAQAQTLDGGTTTLTPGQGASPQEELLAEALGAMVEAGYNPADFDFERAVFDPQGRAVFLPVRVTEEVREQVRALRSGELPYLLLGILYTKHPFLFQGEIYSRGLHPIYARSPVAQSSKGSRMEDFSSGSIMTAPVLDDGCQTNSCGSGSTNTDNDNSGSGTQNNNTQTNTNNGGTQTNNQQTNTNNGGIQNNNQGGTQINNNGPDITIKICIGPCIEVPIRFIF